MFRGTPNRDLIVLAASALLVAGASVLGILVQPPPTPLSEASTFSAHDSGAKAGYLLLDRLGYDVERSFEPLAHLVVDAADAVLIVASPTQAASEGDRRAAVRFLERGGTLLATGAAGTLLPHLETTAVSPIAADFITRNIRTYRVRANDPLTAGVPVVEMAPEAVATRVPAEYRAMFTEGNIPAVLAARIGAGRAIWWTGSDPLLNASIADPGHVELLLNIVGPKRRRVIWSEYYHGHGRSFWSYLSGTPAPAALAQSLLVALVALATFGRRRGPIRPLPKESRTSVLEFVDALGDLYRKAGAAAGAVEIGLARTRRVLANAVGLPTGTSDDRIAAAAANRLGLQEPEVVATLAESDRAVQRGELRNMEALPLVQQLQELASAAQRNTRT